MKRFAQLINDYFCDQNQISSGDDFESSESDREEKSPLLDNLQDSKQGPLNEYFNSNVVHY